MQGPIAHSVANIVERCVQPAMLCSDLFDQRGTARRVRSVKVQGFGRAASASDLRGGFFAHVFAPGSEHNMPLPLAELQSGLAAHAGACACNQ